MLSLTSVDEVPHRVSTSFQTSPIASAGTFSRWLIAVSRLTMTLHDSWRSWRVRLDRVSQWRAGRPRRSTGALRHSCRLRKPLPQTPAVGAFAYPVEARQAIGSATLAEGHELLNAVNGGGVGINRVFHSVLLRGVKKVLESPGHCCRHKAETRIAGATDRSGGTGIRVNR